MNFSSRVLREYQTLLGIRQSATSTLKVDDSIIDRFDDTSVLSQEISSQISVVAIGVSVSNEKGFGSCSGSCSWGVGVATRTATQWSRFGPALGVLV